MPLLTKRKPNKRLKFKYKTQGSLLISSCSYSPSFIHLNFVKHIRRVHKTLFLPSTRLLHSETDCQVKKVTE